MGLSVRQAGVLLGVSYKTAALRLNKLVEDGRLLRAKGGTFENGLASEYDLPELAPAPQPPRRTDSYTPPTEPPPYTRTAEGLVSVWQWRRGRWRHCGDFTDMKAAGAAAGRWIKRRPGWWSIGSDLDRKARGRHHRIYRGRWAEGVTAVGDQRTDSWETRTDRG